MVLLSKWSFDESPKPPQRGKILGCIFSQIWSISKRRVGIPSTQPALDRLQRAHGFLPVSQSSTTGAFEQSPRFRHTVHHRGLSTLQVSVISPDSSCQVPSLFSSTFKANLDSSISISSTWSIDRINRTFSTDRSFVRASPG